MMTVMHARAMPDSPTLVLFNYDWDRAGFARWREHFPVDGV